MTLHVRVEQLLQDVRYGARILTRVPGLSLSAILLVALVIGANTTIYSVVHGMLTNPAPGIQPGGLATVGWIAPQQSVRALTRYSMFRELTRHARSAELAGFSHHRVTFQIPGATASLRGAAVSSNYFDTLRVHAVRGRTLSAGDERLTSELPLVISHQLWVQRFGSADNAVGQPVRLNGRPAIVAGVAPDPFQGIWLGEASEVWFPLELYLAGVGAQLPGEAADESIGIIGRMRDGHTLEAVQDELQAIAQRTFASASADEQKSLLLMPYTGTAANDSLFAERAPQFLAVFTIVTALTLIIASANVANLMLARAVARQREMAVRQSFGASRARIVRLVLAEGAVLSLMAWLLACLVAWWLSETLPRLIPPGTNGGAALVVDVTPDWGVLGYAMLLAIAATVLFTLAPATHTWRQNLLAFLKAGEQSVVQGRSRLSQALVVTQLAFSVLLLTCAGLGYRSLRVLEGAPLGYDPGDALLVTIDTSTAVDTPDGNGALLTAIIERLRATSGLTHVTFSTMSPSNSWSRRPVRASQSEQPQQIETNVVEPEYFSSFATTVMAGRVFDARDRAGAPAVAIVNQHLAEALWPGAAAIGRTLRIDSPERQVTVVGVVPNALFGGVRRDPRPKMLFLPSGQAQIPPGPTVTFQVRHDGLDDAVPAIGRALQEANADVPMVYVRTLAGDLDEITWGTRTLTVLLVVFASGSLLIAALGQYAAMAFSVRRRVRDFGIRIALGASGEQIVRSSLAEGFRLTVAGLMFGTALGVVAARSASALLHGIAPTDPLSYVGVFVVLGMASLVACYLPARRAATVDPMDALRQE